MTKGESGDCFEVAWHIMYAVDEVEDDKWLLCHGVVTGQQHLAGVRFDHAWVEHEVELDISPLKSGRPGFEYMVNPTVIMCIDRSNGLDVEAFQAHYYAVGQIREEEVHRYTKAQMCVYALRSGHFGPWPTKGTEDGKP